jgi:hypothetical protein
MSELFGSQLQTFETRPGTRIAQVKIGQWVCQLRNALQIKELNRKAD